MIALILMKFFGSNTSGPVGAGYCLVNDLLEEEMFSKDDLWSSTI